MREARARRYGFVSACGVLILQFINFKLHPKHAAHLKMYRTYIDRFPLRFGVFFYSRDADVSVFRKFNMQQILLLFVFCLFWLFCCKYYDEAFFFVSRMMSCLIFCIFYDGRTQLFHAQGL